MFVKSKFSQEENEQKHKRQRVVKIGTLFFGSGHQELELGELFLCAGALGLADLENVEADRLAEGTALSHSGDVAWFDVPETQQPLLSLIHHQLIMGKSESVVVCPAASFNHFAKNFSAISISARSCS